jgi:hypothetical protein
VKSLVLVLAIATSTYAQSNLHHSFTFSLGAAIPVQTNCCQNDTVASLGLTYGYRVLPFLQLEAGFTTAANAARSFGAPTTTSSQTTVTCGLDPDHHLPLGHGDRAEGGYGLCGHGPAVMMSRLARYVSRSVFTSMSARFSHHSTTRSQPWTYAPNDWPSRQWQIERCGRTKPASD